MKAKISPLTKTLIFLLIISLIILVYQYKNPRTKIVKNNNSKSTNNLISLLIENEDGTYAESQENSWPKQENYLFNPNLSKCENGSAIDWDGENIKITTNKSEKCYIYFDIYNPAKECQYSQDDSAVCTILRKYGTDKNLFYHDGNRTDSASDLEIGDFSYRYSGSDYEIVDKTKYQFISDIIKTTYHNDIVPNYNSYNLEYNPEKEYTILKEIINQAVNDGYIKLNRINNFVCLPTTLDDSCSQDNLYRILGAFKNSEGQYELEIVKYDYATMAQLETKLHSSGSAFNNYLGHLTSDEIATSSWREDVDGSYPTGDLNLNKLNGTFLNKLSNNDVFANHTWFSSRVSYNGNAKTLYDMDSGYRSIKVGDESCTNNYVKTVCQEEDLKTIQKIGLLLVSEYMYTFDSKKWEVFLINLPYHILDSWLYMGHRENLISGYIGSRPNTYSNVIDSIGTGGGSGSLMTNQNDAIRPAAFIKTEVKFASGTGTMEDPYKFEELKDS